MTFVSDIDCGLLDWDNELWAPPCYCSGDTQELPSAKCSECYITSPSEAALVKFGPRNKMGASDLISNCLGSWLKFFGFPRIWYLATQYTVSTTETWSYPIDGAWQSLHLVILTFLPPSWQIGCLLTLIIDSNEYWAIFKYVHQQHITIFRFGEFCVFVFLMFSFKNKHNIHKWDKNNIWQC